eukprot:scaffold22440_cov132-Skeletonema_dohrnii-CCMP3373.AAC.2
MGRRRRKNRNSQSAYGAVVDNSIKVDTNRSLATESFRSCAHGNASARTDTYGNQPGSAMNPKDTAPQQSDQEAVSVTLPIAGPIAGWLLQSSAIPSDAAVNSRC